MAVSGSAVARLTELELMAHLFRRAGFGAIRDELEAAMAKGYDATVEELLHPERVPDLDTDLIYRYWGDMKESRQLDPAASYWLYRMINSRRPLEEKMALFWHCLFATGWAKLNHAKMMTNQIAMLRQYALGSFSTLLLELSRDPAMIYWLDNQLNTKDALNENYGRELLELFAMGIGSYTEDDVKSCARAFTGWVLKPTMPGAQPYGRFDWQFEFRPDLHDDGEKVFLGERGSFDGTDVIEIITRQPATARFIAMRLHRFFVSDHPDESAIQELAQVFQRTRGDIRAVMRSLFLSDDFRSEKAYYARVKSPVELVVGIVRLVGDFRYPAWGIRELGLACRYMGQDLLNPPSVEGWHTGREWIDTGLLMERVNFASDQVGNVDKPGIREIIRRLRTHGELSPEQLVDCCLDLIGPLRVGERTRNALIELVRQGGPVRFSANGDRTAEARVGGLLRLIVATREFQWV